MTIIAFIVLLGVLIFVHELGHFLTAKAADIEVPRFSIGFGPRILGFKRGETEYVISLLPLGGYVKMAGMEEMEQIEGGPVTVNDTVSAEAPEDVAARPKRPRDFESKSLPARALVISAGVIMNWLLAFVVFTIVALAWGVAADPGVTLGGVHEELLTAESAELATIEPGDRITAVNGQPVESWREIQNALIRTGTGTARLELDDQRAISFDLPASDEARGRVLAAIDPAVPVPPVLVDVVNGGPADRAGLQSGDRIVQADGQPVNTWQEFIHHVKRNPGSTLPLVVERDGTTMNVALVPGDTTWESGIRAGRLGAMIPSAEPYMPRDDAGIAGAVTFGAQRTWEISALTVDFLVGLFSGRHSARNVGGPIMIAQMSGEVVRLGLEHYLTFMAILSINLAVLNLLPIPVLDGGHLVFLGIEAIRGRPLSLESRMRASQVGFVMVLMLMAWAIGNDLLRAIGL